MSSMHRMTSLTGVTNDTQGARQEALSQIQWDSRRLPPAASVGLLAGAATVSDRACLGNWALPMPPLVLWMVSVTVSPRTDVTWIAKRACPQSRSAIDAAPDH